MNEFFKALGWAELPEIEFREYLSYGDLYKISEVTGVFVQVTEFAQLLLNRETQRRDMLMWMIHDLYIQDIMETKDTGAALTKIRSKYGDEVADHMHPSSLVHVTSKAEACAACGQSRAIHRISWA